MNTKEIIELTQKYVMNTYNRLPIAIVRGKGAKVWDAEGNEYLDFVAGIAVCSLGHCNDELISAIISQTQKLMHISNLYYIEPQGELAKIIVENSCGDKVFFCNSGAEANEAAIKLARKYGKLHGGEDKYEIISAYRSFHGRTLATITATGQPKYQRGFEPLPQGFKYITFNDISALYENINEKTCAVILEPIQGEGGIYVAEKEFLRTARELCDKYNALLIFDEVQCGIGRTGKFLAYQHFDIEPDIITLAKALGGGFPIGAMVANKKCSNTFSPGDHASTFGGNPLACSAGIATLNYIFKNGILEHVESIGNYLKEKLIELTNKFTFIKEVRGLGLMLGMELSIDGRKIVERCQRNGLLINCVGENILRFLPPLIITKLEVDEAIRILEKVFSEI
ncbi:MAG: acetylornithine transaminase [Dictyoglomus sp.]|nr:acetylornithine transaminase [Dictyoglomus sp.]MCX7941577.1 acetylornithine transaminase [Dictyoglomaceae bacterium]MDW8187804.1 acetylornithine transaminase [Dictyoglomus sp.]